MNKASTYFDQTRNKKSFKVYKELINFAVILIDGKDIV
jgi:hypothetical protein